MTRIISRRCRRCLPRTNASRRAIRRVKWRKSSQTSSAIFSRVVSTPGGRRIGCSRLEQWLDVDDGTVAAIRSVGGRPSFAALELDAGVAGAGEAVQDQRDQADDQSTLESGPKIIGMKRGHHLPDEQQEHGVNRQQEETEQ